MRFPRVKAEGRAVYHCISRFVGGLFVFGSSFEGRVAAKRFLSFMRRKEAFTGVRVLDYVLMSNHIHLLCEVPEPRVLSQDEVLERIRGGYGRQRVQELQEQIARFAEGPDRIEQINRLLEPYRKRMNDLSIFFKELKGCFAQWYNRRHGRYGALWAERFKSVLLEGGRAVMTLAAYIDLNPVRAGLVKDPKDYRFCGYAKALVGNKAAQAGLMSFAAAGEWKVAAAAYRQRLFVGAGAVGRSGKVVMEREQIKRVLAEGGELSRGQILRLRIRHMTDGVVLGSKGFVNEVFVLHREKFGKKRRSGARAIRGVPLEGLMALRDLRLRAVT
jgi:putative transposase